MKVKTFYFIVLAVACISLISCGTGEKKEDEKTEEAKVSDEEWEALDAFHVIMADVYHPLKDSGNIKPYKERSAEFAAEADKLASAELPAKLDTAKVRRMITSLNASAHSLDKAVKAGVEDKQLGQLLEGVHVLFHQIQEEWYGRHE